MDFSQLPSVVLLVLGFGFVIFWHELGHFLAAKWAGVRVEQFAVGFGQALLSWRKGMGTMVGTSGPKYESLPPEEKARYGETEYRLNWIPLGGYVKMLGQDDLNPNSEAEDPRAYNKQSIGKRMVIVSAGVVMNIILAAIGFMVLFLIGFDAPPAVVGGVLPNSPASQTVREDGTRASLQVGDRILYLDDKFQHDFTKIMLNTALLEEGARIPMYVERRDGQREHLYITPARLGGPKGLLMLGIAPPASMKGAGEAQPGLPVEKMYTPSARAISEGDTIVAVNGQPVEVNEYYKLDMALQASQGKPVEITVRGADGQTRTASVQPHIQAMPGGPPVNFAGMLPRAKVSEIREDSPALGKLMPGDVVTAIEVGQDSHTDPSVTRLTDWLGKAGSSGQAVNLKVLRDGQPVVLEGIVPSVKLETGARGLNIGLGTDELNPVVADVTDGSPAKEAGVPAGATVQSVGGEPVRTWFDVQRVLSQAKAGQPVAVAVRRENGETSTHEMRLTPDQIASIANYHYVADLRLRELSEPRKTTNPLVAAKWGATETRDFILQFYLTLKRMVQGSVSYTNMMGPVGIFHAGTKLAYKGTDWLLWFLSMISANLAVVNFLPIPIVDGGLFTFLVIEKIRGKPLSPYAQQVAQFVGLAVLLGVFLLVTYQDITRLF